MSGLDARAIGHLDNDTVGGRRSMMGRVVDLKEMASTSGIRDCGSMWGGERGTNLG